MRDLNRKNAIKNSQRNLLLDALHPGRFKVTVVNFVIFKLNTNLTKFVANIHTDNISYQTHRKDKQLKTAKSIQLH